MGEEEEVVVVEGEAGIRLRNVALSMAVVGEQQFVQ